MTLDKRPIEGDETAINGKNSSLGIDGKSDRESIKKLGNLGEVIKREKVISRDEDDIFVTKIHLSSWTLTVLDIVMNEYKLTSERRMYLACLSLGSVILEESLSDIVSKQKKLREGILLDDNRLIASLANRHSDISVGSDSVLHGKRVTISMPNWVKDTLGEIAELIGTQVSSLRRIAIYTALNTTDVIPETYQEDIDNNIRSFTRTVDNVLDAYERWIK